MNGEINSIFGNTFQIANVMFTVVPIIIGVIFIFVMLMIFSPKLRAKLMGTQIKATKYMIDENKDNLASIANTASDIATPNITKTVRAIKAGLKFQEQMYCKYCGAFIDSDSNFCKSCGKKQ